MTIQCRKLSGIAAAIMFVLALSACGGGSDAIAPVSSSPPVVTPPDINVPETVSGIALPSSVAVVTATNAN